MASTPASAAAQEVRTGHYSLPLPDGWADRTAITLVAPLAPGGYSPNVVVTRELLCDHLGLGGFADGQGALIRQHTSRFEILASEEGTLGGERALVRTTRWQVGDEEPITQLSAYCLRGEHGVAVVCTAPSSSFAEEEPGFRALLAGFSFVGEA